MQVISIKRLREFWNIHRDAQKPLSAWYHLVNEYATNWYNWADLKANFSSADLVGDCVVFDIGGNKFRLICRVRYQLHRVYILKVMTHKEYDRVNWQHQCGCFLPATTEPIIE